MNTHDDYQISEYNYNKLINKIVTECDVFVVPLWRNTNYIRFPKSVQSIALTLTINGSGLCIKRRSSRLICSISIVRWFKQYIFESYSPYLHSRSQKFVQLIRHKGFVLWLSALTDHSPNDKHLLNLGITNSPLCRSCMEQEEETPAHILLATRLGRGQLQGGIPRTADVALWSLQQAQEDANISEPCT